MTTPWKKRLFKFSKKLIPTLILATLKRAIVLPKGMWFSRRKDFQRVLSIKNSLQKLKMVDIGLTDDNKVFINHSLCPSYRVLWSKSKVLLIMEKINRLMVSNRTVKVKISEISAPISIADGDNSAKYFSDIDLSLVHSLIKAFNLLLYKILSFSL